jgi:hypothetical protein
MVQYQYTPYFENEVLRKRPYLQKEWCMLGGRVLRVVTLEDKVTIPNAFLDRGFKA